MFRLSFFPYRLILKIFFIVKIKNEICYLLVNPYLKNTEIYLIPPFEDYFSRIIRDRNIIVRNNSRPLGNNYYIMENDEEHLYQIFYIEGDALRLKIDYDYLNPRSSLQFGFEHNIPLPTINRTLASIYCYLFYNIDNVSPDNVSDKFQLYGE
jgi:hypothetical protein